LAAAPLTAAVIAVAALQVAGSPTKSFAAEIDTSLGGIPMQAVDGLGAIWILTCRRNCQSPQSYGQLVRVDPSSGRIVKRLSVAHPSGFAIADGSLWVIDFWASQVNRVDPQTGQVTISIPLSLPTFVAPGDRRFLPSSITAEPGTVWVATARGWIASIDAHSAKVVSLVRAPGDTTGSIVADPSGVWVAESVLGVGVVPTGGDQLALHPIVVGRHGRIAVDAVSLGSGRVWASGVVSEPIPFTPGASNPSPGGFGLTNAAAVVILDERTGKTLREVRLPARPYQIASDDGGLIAADLARGRLIHIDQHGAVHQLRHARPGPGTLVAITPGVIWATTKSGSLRRIALHNA
jgi:hypothetical protein